MSNKILIVGINYYPEITSTGLYTTEMCEFLADSGFDVSAITGFPYYPEWKIRKEYLNKGKFCKETINRVKVFRYRQYTPCKVTKKGRIKHILSFTWGSFINSFKVNKPDLVISIIPPTTTALIGWFLKNWFHSKLWVHIQDLEIDAAVDTGLIKESSVLARISFRLERFLFKSADVVSTISPGMMENVKSKGVRISRIEFFPNWVDCNFIKPMEKENRFRKENNLVGKFVVMYAGNIGEKQDWNGVLQLARNLEGVKDIIFVIVGDGAKRDYLSRCIEEKKIMNVKMLTVQPKEDLPIMLSAADVHIIPQKATVKDSVMPSKLLGIMASGRPTIAWGNSRTDLRRVLEKSEGGIFIEVDSNIDYINLSNIVLGLYNNREKLNKYGKNAREFVVRNFSKDTILNKFKKKIENLITESS